MRELGPSAWKKTRGGWSTGKKLQPSTLSRRHTSAIAEEKGREGPWGGQDPTVCELPQPQEPIHKEGALQGSLLES